MPSDKEIKHKPILVVDDDLMVLRSIRRLLKAHGFDVQIFDSAGAFRALPDLDGALCLVLDVDLNGASGIELSRQLVGSGSSLPVIFITANDTDHVRKNAMDVGCLAYLMKPFSSQSLLKAVGDAVALHKKGSWGPGSAKRCD
jgi:FixJ family two-component response regulator